MGKAEGVIKFKTEYKDDSSESLNDWDLRGLNHARQRLYDKKLIGQDARYGGYGYGNVSMLLEPYDAPIEKKRFVITGSQTGHLKSLEGHHYALVLGVRPDEGVLVEHRDNPVFDVKASSESMTHGVVYDCDSSIRYVFHVHSPEIWTRARELNIPTIERRVYAGTPEMAYETRKLFESTDVRERKVFSMGLGHEDGIISFGRTAEEAGDVLLECLMASR